jgi:acyl carrier protein
MRRQSTAGVPIPSPLPYTERRSLLTGAAVAAKQYTRSEIFDGVRECLVESLAIEPDEVHDDALLAQDLGLTSIDTLDLFFSLNTSFNTYIRPTEVQSHLLGGMTQEEFLNPDRTVSDKGYQRIAELVPGFDRSTLTEDLTEADMFQFFRVRHVVEIVEQKLAEKASDT